MEAEKRKKKTERAKKSKEGWKFCRIIILLGGKEIGFIVIDK